MIRRLAILAIFLLAGALVNVAVAWGCAAFMRWPDGWPNLQFGITRSGSEFNDWIVEPCRSIGYERVFVHWTSRDDKILGIVEGMRRTADEVLPAWASAAQPYEVPSGSSVHMVFDARGWPRPALWSSLKVAVAAGYLPGDRHFYSSDASSRADELSFDEVVVDHGIHLLAVDDDRPP